MQAIASSASLRAPQAFKTGATTRRSVLAPVRAAADPQASQASPAASKRQLLGLGAAVLALGAVAQQPVAAQAAEAPAVTQKVFMDIEVRAHQVQVMPSTWSLLDA